MAVDDLVNCGTLPLEWRSLLYFRKVPTSRVSLSRCDVLLGVLHTLLSFTALYNLHTLCCSELCFTESFEPVLSDDQLLIDFPLQNYKIDDMRQVK